MKAIVCTKYGPPEVLQLREVEKPVPQKNEVCVKIHATVVTASDCIVRGLKVPAHFLLPMMLAIGFRKPRRPILGMVMAGEVESVGPGAKAFKPGDQVFGCDFDRFVFGMYAEHVCFPETGMLALKPSTMNYEQAAAIPFGGLMAMHFLKQGQVRSGQKILIYGASGAIGSSAIQLAKHLGADVTGVCSTPNLAWVKSLGADAVVDYTQTDFTKQGKRYDLVLNAVGKGKAKLQCGQALTPTGKHITVDDGTPRFGLEDLKLLKELAEAGKLKAVIDRTYPLEQIVDAHRYVDQGHKKGNVVITVAGN